jgi:hypothetical protein
MPALSPDFALQVLAALAVNITVVDANGNTVFTNLSGVDSSSGTWDDATAPAIATGTQSVLDGELIDFTIEYASGSPNPNRSGWLQATPLQFGNDHFVVIAHHELKDRLLSAPKLDADSSGASEPVPGHSMNELDRLANDATTGLTARSFGVMPLREALPSLFSELVNSYTALLEQAMEQRSYKVRHPISRDLRIMAERLGFTHSGPRDVIDVHQAVIRAYLRRGAKIAEAYYEESRILLLELMGYLVSYYRTYAVGTTVTQGAGSAYGGDGEIR